VREKNKETVWQEYAARVRPLVIDVMIWITAIAALAIIFGMLKLLESMGYTRERIEILENIDFIGIAGVLIVGGFDTFMKVLASIFRGGGR